MVAETLKENSVEPGIVEKWKSASALLGEGG